MIVQKSLIMARADPVAHLQWVVPALVVERLHRWTPFFGDDGVTRFDDWLPSLERAASWNAWTDEEKLLQLAGHLHGQEWNLIPVEDRPTFTDAVKSLRSCMDPETRVLAGQDFRHPVQESGESVAE